MAKAINVVAHFEKSELKTKDISGVQWKRSEKAGDLYCLNQGKSDTPIQFWERKNNRKVTNLAELTRIKTSHSVDDAMGRGRVSYAAPLYSEVVKQIPADLLDQVTAFEVLIENFVQGSEYDTITTVLYKKAK
jgi:hypothetical protein